VGNTLTGLIPYIYAGLDVVSRELIGFIPNVTRDAKAESGAVNQVVRSPVVPPISTENITAGATPADSGDQTIGYVDVSITKSKVAPIRWTGEEQLSIAKDGTLNVVQVNQFAQAFRVLANEVEADLAALYIKASRAYGTAGTTPFATAGDMTDLAEINRILDDNGAPASGRKLILGSAARAKLEGKHSELFKVNESGDAGALLRQRQMRQLMGFTMGYSAGVKAHTAGGMTGFDINNGAGYAVGDTTLTFDGGTVNTTGAKAGDVVTLAGDANKYIIGVGSTATAGDITLNKPGLRVAAADATEMTIGGSYTANMAFVDSAIVLAARVPAMPQGGDDADDVMLITDPVSGITFQVAIYRQYRRVKVEVGLAWGVAGVKSEHTALLIG
jgi:hypothetical protein